MNFELAKVLRGALGEPLEVVEEAHGFRYLDSRDLMGFIDGTENPKGEERAKVALIGAEDSNFAGGSYAYVLRHSFPYGTISSAGLFFIAYTRDVTIPERMLHRLIGTSGDGVHDRLIGFTQAVSGAHFFVPSIEMLESLGS